MANWWQKMKTAILRKNGIISAEQTINLIKKRIPFFNYEGDLYTSLIRVSKHHYRNRKTPLTENEMKLYDLLLSENLCPDTIYGYLKLYMVSDDVKKRFEQGKISKKQLHQIGLNEIRRLRVQKLLSVLVDGRKLFEELDWR